MNFKKYKQSYSKRKFYDIMLDPNGFIQTSKI